MTQKANEDLKRHEGKEYMTMEITDAVMDRARETLIKARMSLLFKHPFFGQLALRLTLTPADRKWCPTAATDGRKFYYNPAFIANLDDKENVFLVGHELGHCIYEHFMRRGGRDPKLYNIAGDYIINNMLDTEMVKGKDYARVITYVKPYLDHKYDGWSSEEVYDDLLEQQQNGGKPEEDGDLIDVHIDMTAGGGGGDEDGDGVEVEGAGGGQGDEDGDGKGLAGKPGPMSEEEQKQLSNEMKDALIQAAQSSGAGNVPGDIKRMIKELLEPEMDWREIIRAQIESSLKSNFTFMRPNRKGWHLGAVLPGMDRDMMIDVAVCIDTSGSISQQMLTEFVSEIAGIMEQYEDYRIRIWQFDTRVYGYDEFTHDDGRDIREYEINGGGGTDFMVNWTYMKEKEIEPDQFIVFTDGMPCGSWGDPDYCDTVFLINPVYGKAEAPFGQTVYYERGKAA
jgi:predicted metal-dependent peptidase